MTLPSLSVLHMEETAKNMKLTVLCRPNGVWHRPEVSRIINGLMTEASEHQQHPEYVILFGHYTKEKVLEALGGGVLFTVTQVTGSNSTELPFRAPFM